ncbi:hypothetical protein BSKO_04055 [Bryopsis sp. KO-2023]|nr:hypothetical protein BSKO_04055 [Bryopsis sp. KO-2023]
MTSAMVMSVFIACLTSVQSATCPPLRVDPELEELKKSQPRMLIGIGAQKSGSSFTFHALERHPQIIGSHTKELHVFDRDDFQTSVESYKNYMKNWEEGLKALERPEDAVLMEFTPKYLMQVETPCRIKHFFPNAKFIVTMREPVSRLLSANAMERRHCSPHESRHKDEWPACCEVAFQSTVELLENALEKLETVKDECMNPDIEDPWRNCPTQSIKPIDRSIYASQIAWWLKHFDASQFIFINAQDLHDNPRQELNRVLKFAGVSPEFNSSVSFAKVSSNTARIVFTEPRLDDVGELLGKFFEQPNQELYRLLEENGHRFSPFQPEPQRSDLRRRPLSDGASLCCAGADFKRLKIVPGFQASSKFCEIQTQLHQVTAISGYGWVVLASVVLVVVLIWWGWKSTKNAEGKNADVESPVSKDGVIEKHGSIVRRVLKREVEEKEGE